MDPGGVTFKKGQSGNPGGREKGAERRAKEAAEAREYIADDGQKYTGREALYHALLDIAFDRDEKARDRTGAIVAFLDRVDGKPKQAVSVSGEVDPANLALLDALRMTPHERRAHLARIEQEEREVLDASQDSTHASDDTDLDADLGAHQSD